jgi:ATP-dependent helicase/nuclease subunit A
LFGVPDDVLYAYKRAGGRFSFNASLPEDLPGEISEPLQNAFERLKQHASWLRRLPPVAAIERITADLGLSAHAAVGAGGNVRAGSIARAIELIRSAQATFPSLGEIVTYLRQLVDGEETHDGLPAATPPEAPVRIMNLHQAKGLEAPFVFLVDPTGQSDHEPDLHVDRSGNRVRGFLRISVKRGEFTSELLAYPTQWETYAAEEKRFQDAEQKRLLYVAATRGGTRLVVAQRSKGNKGNPWSPLEDYLSECPDLTLPKATAATAQSARRIENDAPREAADAIAGRWSGVRQGTYAIAAAKAISVTPSKLTPSSGEHGTEWGTVIHLLLETLMRDPDVDLQRLATAALAEHGLDAAIAEKAVSVAHAVTTSDLWKRAQASPRCLVEVPFQKLAPADATVPDSVPTVLRGVIDLVFREDFGWIVVDYKTDARPESELPSLVDHYRGQVETYANFWQETTGEPIAEMGLYFTHPGAYVKL